MNITEESNQKDKPKVQSLLDILFKMEKKYSNDFDLGEALRKLLKEIRKTI